MKEEESLKKRGFLIKMIPTPRGISSECGFSIRVETDNENITRQLTEEVNSIEIIYLIFGKNRR